MRKTALKSETVVPMLLKSKTVATKMIKIRVHTFRNNLQSQRIQPNRRNLLPKEAGLTSTSPAHYIQLTNLAPAETSSKPLQTQDLDPSSEETVPDVLDLNGCARANATQTSLKSSYVLNALLTLTRTTVLPIISWSAAEKIIPNLMKRIYWSLSRNTSPALILRKCKARSC